MLVLKASLVYFGFVFSAGFLLGTIRVLIVVPLIGVRWAELAEAPLMLLVLTLAARVINRRYLGKASSSACLAAGFLALTFLIAAELTTVLLRGFSLKGYFASRDPVSGAVYCLLLLIYAVMPLAAKRRSDARPL